MSNTLPDIPRLYTALAEWLACMVYIQALPRRFHGWRMGLWAGAGLAALTAFLILTGDLPIGFWLPCMAASCWQSSPHRWNGSSTAFCC